MAVVAAVVLATAVVKESYHVFRIEKKSLENLTVDSLNNGR